MKESAKCRSGRDGDRTGSILPSARGGKTPHAFRNEERIAAEHDRDVVMPARERAALEVVQAQLPLELLIGALGAPALLHDAHDLLLRHATRQRGEDELRWLRLAFQPLHHEPHRLSIAGVGAIVVGDFHTTKCEPRGELAARPLAPGQTPEGAVTESNPELLHCEGLAVATVDLVQRPDLHGGRDRDAHIQAEHPHGVSEVARPTIGGIDEHDVSGDLVFDGAGDEVEREVGLRLEYKVLGDSRLLASDDVVDPRLGHVEREVDGYVFVLRRDRQADADLAIADLPERARVLALHADRMLPLLRKAGVVDDPRRHRLLLLERRDDIARSLPPHAAVIPGTDSEEIQEPSLHALARRPRRSLFLIDAAGRASGNGLDALALALAEDAVRIQRERLLLLASRQTLADTAVEILPGPALHRLVLRARHGRAPSARSSPMDIMNPRQPYPTSRVLYVGITSDLEGRLATHRARRFGFTARYNVTSLVHVETFCEVLEAIAREKRIKG